jgi:predicted RNA-binding Zn-ribbon protein involved in translation (DUF1610 family)
MKAANVTDKVPENNTQQCPRCGQPLKQMRCRIDEAELYCTRCGHSYDVRRLKGKTGK